MKAPTAVNRILLIIGHLDKEIKHDLFPFLQCPLIKIVRLTAFGAFIVP